MILILFHLTSLLEHHWVEYSLPLFSVLHFEVISCETIKHDYHLIHFINLSCYSFQQFNQFNSYLCYYLQLRVYSLINIDSCIIINILKPTVTNDRSIGLKTHPLDSWMIITDFINMWFLSIFINNLMYVITWLQFIKVWLCICLVCYTFAYMSFDITWKLKYFNHFDSFDSFNHYLYVYKPVFTHQLIR